MGPQEKMNLAAQCGAEYPCAEENPSRSVEVSVRPHLSCESDFSGECPAGKLQHCLTAAMTAHAPMQYVCIVTGWVPQKGYCTAPPGYDGRCSVRMAIQNMSARQKKLVGDVCGISWPCKMV